MLDLRIDTDLAIEKITNYLQHVVARDATRGVLLGMSGGLDSSVLAGLAVRAVGPGGVDLVYLFDRDSDGGIAANARLMADWLGVELEVIDITGDMARQGVYKPLFIRALRLSPLVARVSAASFKLIGQESPFRATLRVGAGETLAPWTKRLLFEHTVRHLDAGFTARHVFRRAVLDRMARARNLSLIGAANLSECTVGWFVKDGIDDLPVQPIAGLYKTQVRQLAEALDLPEPVRTQRPSPDMAKGVTDEFGIDHDYSDVDVVVDALDRGMSDGDIAAMGYAPAEIADIRTLMRLSDWKRGSPHEAPPVDGRVGSAVRA